MYQTVKIPNLYLQKMKMTVVVGLYKVMASNVFKQNVGASSEHYYKTSAENDNISNEDWDFLRFAEFVF